jgi:hypothetical protein
MPLQKQMSIARVKTLSVTIYMKLFVSLICAMTNYRHNRSLVRRHFCHWTSWIIASQILSFYNETICRRETANNWQDSRT